MTPDQVGDPDPTSRLTARLVTCVRDAARQFHGKPFHVVPTFDLSERAAETLLSMDGVAGLILWTRAPALEERHPGRVAHWRLPDKYDWIVPERRAGRAIVFGDRAAVGFRILRTCTRCRIAWLLCFETFLFFPSKKFFVPFLLFKKVVQRLILKFSMLSENTFALWLARFRFGRLLGAGKRLRLDPGEFDARRVLYVTGTLGPGGSERQLVATSRGVKTKTDFDVLVVCSSIISPEHEFFLPDLEKSGIPVVNLRDTVKLVGSDKVVQICRELLVRKEFLGEFDLLPVDFKDEFVRHLVAMEQYRPGIVHAFLDEANIKAALAALVVGVPKIVLSARSLSPRNFSFHRPHMLPAYQAILENENVTVLNNSVAGAESYRSWLRNPDQDIQVVYNGVETPEPSAAMQAGRTLRAGLGIADEALVVGSAMRLSEEKEPLLWAHVAVAVARRLANVRFLLAGDGPLRGEIEELAEDSGLGERLHLLGHIRDTAAFMAALDLYVLTSRAEGLPNVLIEAQALGTPVVTTPAGGAVEALEPGRSGLVSADWTVASLSEACVTLLTDEALRARFARHGPEYVRRKFGVERMIGQTLDVYGRCPDRRGRAVGGAEGATGPEAG